MRANLKTNLLAGSGYVSFFFFAFFLSAYLTFPYERLRGLIEAKLGGEPGAVDSPSVQIGELQPSFGTGVKLANVDITRPVTPAEPKPASLHLDSLSLRVSPWALLIGTLKVNLAAEVGKGSLEAHYSKDSEAQHIEAELDAFDLNKLGLGGWLGLPLKGKATGTLSLALAEDPLKTTGELALKIARLQIGDGKAKIKIPGLPGEGMTLDAVDAGTLDLALRAHDGVAELERFTTDGKDLKAHGVGSLHLANPLRHTRPDLQLDLKFSDAYKNKSDRTKSLFEIMGLQSEWRRALTPDGALHLRVGGTFQGLRAIPASGPAAAPARGAPKTRKSARIRTPD